MYAVDHNDITLTKGDCCSIEIKVMDTQGRSVTTSSLDTYDLSIRKSETGTVVLHKQNNAPFIQLVHSDTKDLSAGEYLYNVCLQNSEGEYFTIIPMSRFNIVERV